MIQLLETLNTMTIRTEHKRRIIFLYMFIIIIGFNSTTIMAQYPIRFEPIITIMTEFEGNRDPKCAATANRLEDFMYGTPLLEEARIVKANLQKDLMKSIWISCDEEEKKKNKKAISILAIENELNKLISISEKEPGLIIIENPEEENFEISKRDLAHYSSVAYAYRVILSVQQDVYFEQKKLLPFETGSEDVMKSFIDKTTLAVLQIADKESKKNNEREMSAETFTRAWNKVFAETEKSNEPEHRLILATTLPEQLGLVNSIIESKQKAFEKYNNVSMYLFERNAQVYFSRHAWPNDEQENREFKILYNETLIQFVKDLWSESERMAHNNANSLIRLEDVSAAIDLYLPYEANQLEDITFFPRLQRSMQIDVEAYDLDAFRDGGVHWTYIQMALNDDTFTPTMSADPFALELLSEAVAHVGVLSLRVAGEVAKEQNHERLSTDDFIEGLKEIQSRIIECGKEQGVKRENNILSSDEIKEQDSDLYFSELNNVFDVQFNHRSSDWLNRFIRSYSVDSAQGIIRTAIPPAFGGAGIAAEDINNDGFPDLLLLSGLGNAIYLNTGKGSFKDYTIESGISWVRDDDKKPGEPRQPIIADFDNDGLQDVFISFVNDKHHIYRNTGDAVFEDMTLVASLGGEGKVGGPCTAFDFDNDGLLDIYIGYFGNYLQGIPPTLARKSKNGTPNKLFKNLGDFKFAEVNNSGLENVGWTQSVGHSDINGDNLQDIIVGNDFGINSYYLNLGNGKFKDIATELGTDKPSFTMNIGIADLNRDYFPDFYISNIVVMEKDEKYVRPQADSPMKLNPSAMANMRVVEANDLFLSNKNDSDSLFYILSKNIARGFSSTGWSWDADFFDFDNDGDQDLYCLTGMNDFLVYSAENPYYQDSKGIDRQVMFAGSSREPNVFFENDAGQLNILDGISGMDVVYNSRSAVYVDMDMDGDEDVIMNNYHDAAVAFKNNTTDENNWIKIRLIGNPEEGITRDAIGSKIITTAKKIDVWSEVHSTTGYLSVHPKEQHIGLGKAKSVDVKVIWPNGTEDEFKNVIKGKRYIVLYGEGIKERY